MNILFVENDEKLIDLILKNCSETIHDIILVNNPTDALLLLEQSNDIDLIITEINFFTLNTIFYLKKIREFKKNIFIIITSELDINLALSEFLDLNIIIFLKKPYSFDKLKEVLSTLNKEINIIFNKQEAEQLKLLIKLFKEFSFYSETDLDGRITDISDSLCNLLGFMKEELIGQKHSILKHSLENSLKYVEIWKNITNGKTWIGELRCKDRFGNDIWFKSIIFPKKDINEIIVGYGAKRQDITDKKIAELQSITDDLTNLYNKRFFKQIFSSERNRAKRNQKNLVLLILDIDNFKKYNDTYGHLEGDRALKKVAFILKSNAKRANDFTFRLGGEEFAIITSNLSVDKIMKYTQRIREAIFNQKIIHKNNADIGFITVSIGVFNLEIKDNYSCDEIYKFADIALYRAKNLGRNKVVIFK